MPRKITLKTLPKATAQRVFNQAATHLLTQKEKAIAATPVGQKCMYRTSEGLMCAAGCFIGSQEYRVKFENLIWTDLVNDGFAPDTHAGLIRDLQEVHDQHVVSNWKKELRRVARSHELSDAVLKLPLKKRA